MVVNVNNHVALAIASSRPAPNKPQTTDTGNDVPKTGKVVPQAAPADVESLVEQINDFIAANSRNLQFRVDNATKRTVIMVVDTSSGDVVRQIPSEEVLRLAAHIKDITTAHSGAGLHLVDQRA